MSSKIAREKWKNEKNRGRKKEHPYGDYILELAKLTDIPPGFIDYIIWEMYHEDHSNLLEGIEMILCFLRKLQEFK